MKGNLKGQQSMAVTIVVVAVALIVGVLVFATIQPILDNTAVLNESIGGPFNVSSTDTTRCISLPPIAPGSTITVYNSSSPVTTQNTLTVTTEYQVVRSTGCFTNATAGVGFLRISYSSGVHPIAGQAAATAVGTNVYSAFTLGAIVIIVIAAAAILRNLGLF